MATRRDRSKDLEALARTLIQLMREHEVANHTRLKITPALSRLLKHAPEWRRLKPQKAGQTPREAQVPSFFTLVDAAQELKVPLCALVPTEEHQPLTAPQRKLLTLFSRWALANFSPRQDERASYQSDFDDFEAYASYEKLEWKSGASRVGVDAQLEPETVDVLASIPGVRTERMQVTTIRGESMADRYHDGDRILVDTQRRTPWNRDVVVVDRGHLGRTIGRWRQEGDHAYLDKDNDAPIDLGTAGDYTILGIVVGIVWSPERRGR